MLGRNALFHNSWAPTAMSSGWAREDPLVGEREVYSDLWGKFSLSYKIWTYNRLVVASSLPHSLSIAFEAYKTGQTRPTSEQAALKRFLLRTTIPMMHILDKITLMLTLLIYLLLLTFLTAGSGSSCFWPTERKRCWCPQRRRGVDFGNETTHFNETTSLLLFSYEVRWVL